MYFIMWRSRQPRFQPDLNRGLYRERVGVVLSAPIRSYYILMSILTIGSIVENFLAAKIFSRLTRFGNSRNTPYDKDMNFFDIFVNDGRICIKFEADK